MTQEILHSALILTKISGVITIKYSVNVNKNVTSLSSYKSVAQKKKKKPSLYNHFNQTSRQVQLRISEFNTVCISNQSVNDLNPRFSPWGRQMVTVSVPEQHCEQDLGASQRRGGVSCTGFAPSRG